MINFFNERTNYQTSRKRVLKKWIKSILIKEKYILGEVNIIICNDNYLKKINKKYLKRDSYTDIITFSMMENPEKITGDLFISINRVKANAKEFKQPIDTELSRVIIHGILHMMGYKDKTDDEIKGIRMKEEECLKDLEKMLIAL